MKLAIYAASSRMGGATYLQNILPELRHQLAVQHQIIDWKPEAATSNNAKAEGIVVQPKRLIVERSNAWINQCRVLWKNCEGLLSTSEAKIKSAPFAYSYGGWLDPFY